MTSFSTDAGEIRRFGMIAGLFGAALFTAAWWRGATSVCYISGVLICIAIGFLLLPVPCAPIYRTWIRCSHLVGTLLTLVSLTLTYYLVISPAALIIRIVKGPSLPLKPNEGASTYWVIRSEGAQRAERFVKRY